MREHEGKAPAVCFICNSEFKQWSNLYNHMFNFHNDNLINCKCGKKFIYKSGYDQHKCNFSEKRNFICEICGKYFDDRHKFNVIHDINLLSR